MKVSELIEALEAIDEPEAEVRVVTWCCDRDRMLGTGDLSHTLTDIMVSWFADNPGAVDIRVGSE